MRGLQEVVGEHISKEGGGELGRREQEKRKGKRCE